MIAIKVNRNGKKPVTIELDAANVDELSEDILSIGKNIVEAMANTTDSGAESLRRALLANKMLELGAQCALDAIMKN